MIELVYSFLSAIFILIMPGYCFCLAVFPKKTDVSLAERIAFSVFFSITLPALLLITAYSVFGITVDFLTVLSTALAIIVFSLAAYFIRRGKIKESELFPILPKH